MEDDDELFEETLLRRDRPCRIGASFLPLYRQLAEKQIRCADPPARSWDNGIASMARHFTGCRFHGSIMEQQPPPLSPQDIAAMQTAQYADLGQPQTVKVFGIMHVIFAGFGLLMSVWAVFVIVVGNPFLNLMPKTPEMAAQAKAQAAMQESMMPMTIISTVLTVLVGAMMLKAGILLLKQRRGGLRWSNRYAWASLASKVANIALAFIYTLPAMKSVTAMPGATSALPPGQMEIIMIGTTLLTIVAMSAYPIIALILLNRPKTKEWFANRPE